MCPRRPGDLVVLVFGSGSSGSGRVFKDRAAMRADGVGGGNLGVAVGAIKVQLNATGGADVCFFTDGRATFGAQRLTAGRTRAGRQIDFCAAARAEVYKGSATDRTGLGLRIYLGATSRTGDCQLDAAGRAEVVFQAQGCAAGGAEFLLAVGTFGPAQGDVLTTVGTGLNVGHLPATARTDCFVGEEAQRAVWTDDLTALGTRPRSGLELGATFGAVCPGKGAFFESHGGGAGRFADYQVERLAAGGAGVGVSQHIGATGRALAHEEQVAAGADLGVDQQFQTTVGAVEGQVVTAGSTDDVFFAGGCAAMGAIGSTAGGTKAVHQHHGGATGGTGRAAGRYLTRPI